MEHDIRPSVNALQVGLALRAKHLTAHGENQSCKILLETDAIRHERGRFRRSVHNAPPSTVRGLLDVVPVMSISSTDPLASNRLASGFSSIPQSSSFCSRTQSRGWAPQSVFRVKFLYTCQLRWRCWAGWFIGAWLYSGMCLLSVIR